MKLKKEYAILIGIILILLVYLIFSGGRNRMGYKIPILSAVSEDEMSRIEITRGETTIMLTGQDESWKVMPQEYPADFDRIQRMLEVIAGLTLTELAAEKEDYHRYELDEGKRIRVKAYRGEQVVREFDIGKPSSTYRHTFVRIGDDPRVYHARESFRSTFDYDLDGLRDKSVMKFAKEEITEITIVKENLILQLKKERVPVGEDRPEEGLEQGTQEKEGTEAPSQEPKTEEIWVMEDGTKAKKSEVDSLLNQVTDLKCEKFIEGKGKEEYADPVYTVIFRGAKDHTLHIFAKDEDEDKYPAVSSESAYVFFLSTWKAENIMKDKDKLIEKE